MIEPEHSYLVGLSKELELEIELPIRRQFPIKELQDLLEEVTEMGFTDMMSDNETITFFR